MAISLKPLSARLGVEISGLDLARPLGDADFAAVRQASLDHLVFAISDLDLSVNQLVAFAQRFGPLVEHILDQYHHPETREISVLTNDSESPLGRHTEQPAGAFWHTDLGYMAVPADYTLLYAVETPPSGGDTLFVNMVHAYETLPGDVKRRIDGLSAIHRVFGGQTTRQSQLILSAGQQDKTPDVAHPIVRTHRETGRKALFVSPGFTVRIREVGEAENRELLDILFAHATRPEVQYRHEWRAGQLVACDNRATMHCATGGYAPPARRTLFRAIVGGVGPV